MALKELLADPANFKYNSRSLKFGNDRPGGGSSKQPYVTTPLPKVDSDPISTFPDFLLRDPKNALNDRVDDLKRVTKFLVSREGGLFVAKQQLLSLQNPIVPGRPNRATPISGLYNPLMTLAQVGASGTGLHIEKQGLFPITDNTTKYDYIYRTKHQEENTNRLTLLYKSKIAGFENPDDAITGVAEGFKLGLTPSPTIGFDPNVVMSYKGGPNAKLRNGRTTIPFADNRVYGSSRQYKLAGVLEEARYVGRLGYKAKPLDYNNYLGVSTKAVELKYATDKDTAVGNFLNNQINGNNSGFNFDPSVYYTKATFPDTNPTKTTKLGVFTLKQRQLVSRTPIGSLGSTSLTNISDFRKEIRQTYTQNDEQQKQDFQGLIYFDYKSPTINREQRIGLGNPGKRNRDRSKLTFYTNDALDRINILPPYYSDVVADSVVLTRDLVKFRFEIIDNAKPSHSTFLHFRAFLGSISDNFKSDWTPVQYVGRGDKFYNYSGFSRDISFSFKVHPQSRAEMRSIYQKLNLLAASLAPDYRGGYMKGNLIRLTIGDYLYIVPGFISSLTYTIPEESAWEIALSSPEDGQDYGMLETPKYFDVSVSFTAIHDFAPQLGTTAQTAFITPQATVENVFLSGKDETTGKYTDKTKSYVTRTTKDRITTDPGGFDDTTASNLSIFTSVRSEDPTKVISTIDGQTNFAGGENTLVGTTPEVTIPGFNSSFS